MQKQLRHLKSSESLIHRTRWPITWRGSPLSGLLRSRPSSTSSDLASMVLTCVSTLLYFSID